VRLHRLASLDLPELEPYRSLRRQEDHRRRGTFVAEGAKVVCRLLESPIEIVSVLLPERWYQQLEPLVRARGGVPDIYLAERALLQDLTGFSMYQGLLALARVPPSPDLDTLLEDAVRPRLIVAIEGLSNAENVGVVTRNAVALGACALIAGPICASPWLRRAVRASMGAVFGIPICESADLPASLARIRARGVRALAAHPRPGARSLYECDLSGELCLVFGSEGDGLPETVAAACDDAVAIPMCAGVDSLNVGSATAIFLAETARRRFETERERAGLPLPARCDRPRRREG